MEFMIQIDGVYVNTRHIVKVVVSEDTVTIFTDGTIRAASQIMFTGHKATRFLTTLHRVMNVEAG